MIQSSATTANVRRIFNLSDIESEIAVFNAQEEALKG